MTAPQQRKAPSGGPDVLERARLAWDWHDVSYKMRNLEHEVEGIIAALDLPEHRHTEIFVEEVNEVVWSALKAWPVMEGWKVRAILPLHRLGNAHEILREHGYELQGYWSQDDGQIAFGTVERA